MKAVNLIPVEARIAEPGSIRGASRATYGLFGALFAALVLVALYVVASNDVTSRNDELARTKAETAVTASQAALLKPYADLAALRESTAGTVEALAKTRYDWPTTLDQLSRLVPSDVTLTSFDGKLGEGTGTATATGGSSSTLGLKGCTSSQSSVARLMERVRRIDGVADVALGTSSRVAAGAAAPTTPTGTTTDTTAASGDCGRRDEFDLTLTLEARPAAGATAATPATASPPATPATTTATPATTTATPAATAPATGPSK